MNSDPNFDQQPNPYGAPDHQQAQGDGPPQPGYQQAEYRQPGYQQPQYAQPGYQQPGYPQNPANGNNDRAIAALAHWAPIVVALLFAFLVPLLGALLPFVVPLIVMTANRSVFVKEHARESLNFQLTILIPGIFFAVLTMVLTFGWVFSLLLYLGCMIMQTMGTVKAGNGEWFRYPVSIRFVPAPGQPTNWAPPPNPMG